MGLRMAAELPKASASTTATTKKRGIEVRALVWVVGLITLVPVSSLLPIPGSPVFLAGFVGFCGLLILLARHWLIVVLSVLATLGPYFLPLAAAGVNVFGFRLLIMLLAPFSTPLTNRGAWWFNPVARFAAVLLAFWISWGLVSLTWTPDAQAGMVDIMTLVFAFGLLLVLYSLDAYKPEHLDKLRIGWVLALVAAGLSALLEIGRGYGLPTALDDAIVSSVSLEHSLDPAIRSTLGFSSDFGGFLLLTVPFVLWSIERATGPLGKLIYAAALAAIGVLVLYSASRMGLVGLVVQFLVYGLVLQRRWYVSLGLLAGGLAAAIIGLTLLESSNLRITEKLETVAATGSSDRSMNHRGALTMNGLWMVYNTAGRGIGAAGFEKTIAGEVPFPLPIQRIKEWNAHNHWVEVLSEYGVLVFAAIIALLGWIGLIGWRAHRRSYGPDKEPGRVGRAIVVGLIGYLFCGVASGSIISKPTHWMYFATLVAMAAFLVEISRNHRREVLQATLTRTRPI